MPLKRVRAQGLKPGDQVCEGLCFGDLPGHTMTVARVEPLPIGEPGVRVLWEGGGGVSSCSFDFHFDVWTPA